MKSMRSALHEAHSEFYEFSNQQVVRVGKPTQRHNKGGFLYGRFNAYFQSRSKSEVQNG